MRPGSGAGGSGLKVTGRLSRILRKGTKDKADCEHGIQLVKIQAPGATVEKVQDLSRVAHLQARRLPARAVCPRHYLRIRAVKSVDAQDTALMTSPGRPA